VQQTGYDRGGRFLKWISRVTRQDSEFLRNGQHLPQQRIVRVAHFHASDEFERSEQGKISGRPGSFCRKICG
jgi:hypothetical protein